MSKVLVISGANFALNKVDTVVISDVHCTGITIDATLTMDHFEYNHTLVPVLTPENTTDSVTWESSSPDIASVNGGVVTSHRPGTATITATCNGHSASCAVTVAITAVAATGKILNWPYSTTRNNPIATNAATGATVGRTNGTKNAYKSGDFANVYLYPIPSGAKTITVQKTDWAFIIVYYNSTENQTSSSSEDYSGCAAAIDGETQQGGYSNSISSWTYDERTFTIPQTAGIDSFTLGINAKSSSVFNNFDPANPGITITFGFETPSET